MNITRSLALAATLLLSLQRSAAQSVVGFSEVETITGPTTTLSFVGLEYSGDTLTVSTFGGSQSFGLAAPSVELTFKEGNVEVLGQTLDFAYGPSVFYLADVFGGAKVEWRGKTAEPGFSILDILPPPEFTVNLSFSGGPGDAVFWAISPVPEPEQVALASGVGLLGLAGVRRWRKR